MTNHESEISRIKSSKYDPKQVYATGSNGGVGNACKLDSIMTPDCKTNFMQTQSNCRSTVFTQNSKVQTNGQYKYEGYSGIKMNCKSNERNVKTLSRPLFSIPKIYTLEKCWLAYTKMIER